MKAARHVRRRARIVLVRNISSTHLYQQVHGTLLYDTAVVYGRAGYLVFFTGVL